MRAKLLPGTVRGSWTIRPGGGRNRSLLPLLLPRAGRGRSSEGRRCERLRAATRNGAGLCSTERGRQRHADPAGRGKPQARKEEGCWYGPKRARATSQDQEGGNRREGWRAGRALDMAHGLAEALGSMMQYYRSGRLRTWRSFKEACCQYTFPGSHQVIWQAYEPNYFSCRLPLICRRCSHACALRVRLCKVVRLSVPTSKGRAYTLTFFSFSVLAKHETKKSPI